MVSKQRIEEMIQENADWARDHGYESSAQFYEKQLAERRAESDRQSGEQQGKK